MRKEVKKNIDGLEYTFYQFPATDGTKVLIRLSKLLGEPLGMLGGDVLKGGIKGAVGTDAGHAIGKAVKALTDNIDVEETYNLIMMFFKHVQHNGNSLSDIYDVHFQGKYSLVFKILKAALEVQYGNFFGELAAMSGAMSAGTSSEK